MIIFRKRIDKEVLSKAIEYLETPREVSYELSDVPDYVIIPLGFFTTDYYYLKHHDRIIKKNITVDKMNMRNIRTMFTFFNRGEHFSIGFIAGIINSGELLSVYKRLKELL